MLSASLTSGWQTFERLQHSVDSRIVTSDTLGGEEALSDLLDDFTADFTPSAEYVERRFRSLRCNRVRKQRHRICLLFRAELSEQVAAPDKRIDDADELRFVRSQVTSAEWGLFERVSLGFTYDELARDNGVSPGQLRARLCRLRSRLRLAA